MCIFDLLDSIDAQIMIVSVKDQCQYLDFETLEVNINYRETNK